MLTSISNEQTYKNKDLSLSLAESVKFCAHMSTAKERQPGVENTMRKLLVPQSAGRQLPKADGSRTAGGGVARVAMKRPAEI